MTASLVLAALLLLASSLLLAVLPGCAHNVGARSGKLSVVCTIFPQYDWVRQIAGGISEDIELTILLKNKIDLHSYEPSVDDFAKISACDLFIYVGGVSDAWAGDALKEAKNKDMVVINLMQVLGEAAKVEEFKDGMTALDEEDGEEYDEHVWLSLRNARLFCGAIAEALSALDSDNAGRYMENCAAYDARLAALDADYRAFVDGAAVRTLLFGDRFPFRYLTEDYNLDYYAAFLGCSAETETGFGTIAFLANKMDELHLKHVMVTENADMSIARTIISNSAEKDGDILVLNSLQSVTSVDAADGETYLSVMGSNLDVLKVALG
ncbi:MAG: metal ABC transporter substrate-binding protein [Oscillospiraceae bacterium]|nr:metal ABC transporter substrate-binding protein [Oscillospiraceae bacterium]